MKRVNTHFGGWLDDLLVSIKTPSPITLAQQNPVTEIPATESFFAKNSGLIIGAVVLLAMGGTFLVLQKRNQKKA